MVIDREIDRKYLIFISEFASFHFNIFLRFSERTSRRVETREFISRIEREPDSFLIIPDIFLKA